MIKIEPNKDSFFLSRTIYNYSYEESDRYENNRQNNGNDN